ncbi:hypothetical protein [Sulfitobacter sp. R18_1]|uniref:hypothetical protein n=1 Tax=Sulfitobacter sp. R18_1 TaxID=2821104 RepID=UPI001ADC0BA6|nr:hypothetical protein [Sulfitobacter sp. R18_1]MBO9428246.1 hypothetical protein [Sulfitobacter sp. R18_1]
MTKKISISLHKFEDLVDPSFMSDLELPATNLSGELFEWFQNACQAAADHPLMQPKKINDHIPEGEAATIEVVLCHPKTLGEVFDIGPRALGIHNISVADCDPFGDDSCYTDKQRVLISWDAEFVSNLIQESAYDEQDYPNAAMAWLTTLTHELQHVRLFMENGNFNTPKDIEVMEEEIGHDLFDISSGYGIRSLDVGGDDHEPEDMEDARALMEEHVEDYGRRMTDTLFTDDLSPNKFLEISGVLDYMPATLSL